MSSDFKLEGVKSHEIKDPEVGSPNGIHNILAERRTLTLIDSLKYVNIAMVTILKNVTNILTALGELFMFLMIIPAISSGITDISFDTVGYAWQFSTCILTASYSIDIGEGSGEFKCLPECQVLHCICEEDHRHPWTPIFGSGA
ncbi:GDP-mannose transporter GONST1-like [Rosa rugosa]|uniref:GDP-mannose transporter GONST1-like n=1 Tax=Rosa rugosa TaxID=74645 RepID=UPI002B40472F|nr:GDP-mannose transporter GONST1-like [Rosa rugosa]